MEELAPKAAKPLAEAGYTVGASPHEFTSSWKITKVCIASILSVVYKTICADTKSNKYHVGLLAANISSGGNKLREYLTSASDTVVSASIIDAADINTSTGPMDTSIDGRTSSNTSMDMADDIVEDICLVLVVVVYSTMNVTA